MKITIAIPVFNRVEFILQAVRSALSQDVEGLDVVVIDNFSDDGTWEALDSVNDIRLRKFRNDRNIGMWANFNKCAEVSWGEYVLFLCSDDILRAGFVRRAIETMDRNHNAVLLSSKGELISECGKSLGAIADHIGHGVYDGVSVTPAWFWINYNYVANPLNFPSGVVFRANALQLCLPFRAELGAPADIDMYLRVLRHGQLIISNDVGCSITRHSRQKSIRDGHGGLLIAQSLKLIDIFRAELEYSGIYSDIRRQVSCMLFSNWYRKMPSGQETLNLLRPGLKNGLWDVGAAVLKMLLLRAARRVFGLRLAPHLKQLSAAR